MRGLPQVEPTLVDRAISWLSPETGLRRHRARALLAMSGGYAGARKDRRATSEWQTSGGSADADLLPDLALLRERSRALDRDAPLARGAINTVVTNVVGTGLAPQPQIDREFLGLSEEEADRWEAAALRIWDLWGASKNCDVRLVQDGVGLQELALRTVLLGGDVLAIKRFRERRGLPLGFCWQLVEGDRLTNPRFVMDGRELDNGNRVAGGVEADRDGMPVAYHVLNRHPGDLVGGSPREWTRIPAFSDSGRRVVLHLYRPMRPDQTRGEPYLAPVIESLKMLGRYSEAELMAAVVGALFTVFVKTQDGEGLGLMDPTTETGAKASDKDMKLASGAIVDLAQGEDITIADPGRPNQAFDGFVLAVLRQIGVALELPFEVLNKHFTASYSAARAALLEAWKFFRSRRQWLAAEFCQPSYAEVIGEAVMRGMLTAPGFFDDPMIRAAWLGTDWVGPTAGQINPKDEIDAARERVALGVSNRAIEAQEITGRSWETIHRQAVKERRMRKEDDLEPSGPAPAAPSSRPPQNPDLPEAA